MSKKSEHIVIDSWIRDKILRNMMLEEMYYSVAKYELKRFNHLSPTDLAGLSLVSLSDGKSSVPLMKEVLTDGTAVF